MLRLSNACHLQTVWQTLPSTTKLPSSPPCAKREDSVKIETDTDDSARPWVPDIEIIPNIPSVSKELSSSSLPASRPASVKGDKEAESEFEKEIPAALIMNPPHHNEGSLIRFETSTSFLEKDEDVKGTDEDQEEPPTAVETSHPLPPPSTPVIPSKDPVKHAPPPSIPTNDLMNPTPHFIPSSDLMDPTPPPSIPSLNSMEPIQPSKSRRRYHFLGSRLATPDISPSPSQMTDPPLSKMSKRKTFSKKLKQVFTNNKTKKSK